MLTIYIQISQLLLLGSGGDYAFNLHPDITTLGSAYLDLLTQYSWKTITILYQVNNLPKK